LSTTEVEFVEVVSCVCHVVLLRRILDQLGESQGKCTVIQCDNISSINDTVK